MKNIWNIYRTDLKNIRTNWVALILIGGLALLPSLYAWFNIKAAWDPYAQTDQIPVAIVNEDEGSKIRDTEIHVGNELVESLKDNDSMSWQFVSRKKAMKEIDKGNYFATIIIPEDFSKNLATVVEKNQKQATIEYFVNEKINAISPKITEKGASVLVDEVSSKFISEVNGTIFGIFNDLGIELENELPDIERFKEYLLATEEALPNIFEKLEETLTDSESVETILKDVEAKIPEVKRIVNEAIQTVDSTIVKIDEVEEFVEELIPEIESEIKKVEEIQTAIHQALDKDLAKEVEEQVPEMNIAEIKQQIDATIKVTQTVKSTVGQANIDVDKINEQIDKANELLEEDKQIEHIESSISTEEIDQFTKKLDSIETTLTSVSSSLDKLENVGPQIGDNVNKIKEIEKKIHSAQENLQVFVNDFKTTLVPQVEKKVKVVKGTLAEGRAILVDVNQTLPLVEEIVERTKGNLGEGQQLLTDIMNEYPYIYGKVQQLSKRVQDMDEKMDLHELIDLLQNDPEGEASFFEQPVLLEEEALYPIPNYGSGMTPFYTALALWVGGLLLISLVSVNAKGESYKPYELYFGRYFTFITIGFVQAFIVAMGNIFILKAYVKEPVYFVLLAMFISFIFITIIYTFVSVFGDVGKSLAIVLLVLQIAGSGGTYPAVLLPPFFQSIHPFLPFTYGVNMLREAVGGIIWSEIFIGMGILFIFVVICFTLAIFLKGPINKRQEVMMKKSKESGLFD